MSDFKRSGRPKTPDPADVQVGLRIKLRRKGLGISQIALASAIGVTFQQVQKYEKGTNRVGASRLMKIAGCLNVPVSHFFADQPGSHDLEGSAHTHAVGDLVTFVASAEGLALNTAFREIRTPRVKKRFLALVKAISDQQTSERQIEGTSGGVM